MFDYETSLKLEKETTLTFLGRDENDQIVNYNTKDDCRNLLRFMDVLTYFTPEGGSKSEGKTKMKQVLALHPNVIMDWISKVNTPVNPFSFWLQSFGNQRMLAKIMKEEHGFILPDAIATKTIERR